MRVWITWLFRVIFRLFYRRIEIVEGQKVPKDGPVMLVLNHPNGLLDPGLVLCYAPRPVSFLAKSTLFRMPIVSSFVKAFDSIPVYRRVDASNQPTNNQDTFARSRELLKTGGILALFPEGTTHSEPRLKPLKTGAARIAIGASTPDAPVQIVPAGLYFPHKGRFRSDALLRYGDPIVATYCALDPSGEPPRAAVVELTAQIQEALDAVTLQADRAEALDLITRTEAIFSAAMVRSLSERLDIKRRLMEGYTWLKQRAPERLEALQGRIEALEQKCQWWGVEPQMLSADFFTLPTVLSYAFRRTSLLLALLPLASLGILLNAAPYLLVDALAPRLSKGEDEILATVKVLSAMLFYPLFWLLCGGLAWWLWGLGLGLAVVLLAPFLGAAALFFLETFGGAWRALSHLGLFVTRKGLFQDIVDEQQTIRAEIFALEELLGEGADER